MPKVFFIDTGIRNGLLQNFSPFLDRTDRGELFEQLVYLLLKEKNNELFFWATQSGQEIDFILPSIKKALEVKWNSFKTGKNKHKNGFLEKYPEFSYEEISSDTVFEVL